MSSDKFVWTLDCGVRSKVGHTLNSNRDRRPRWKWLHLAEWDLLY